MCVALEWFTELSGGSHPFSFAACETPFEFLLYEMGVASTGPLLRLTVRFFFT